jgi:hypothetical protein
MITRVLVIAALPLLAAAGSAFAADHSLTAIEAGALTEESQPFQNGTNNPGRSSEDVVGQGSPLSGEDSTTPATDQPNNGQVNTPKPVEDGKTAPSQHSALFKK